MKSLVEVKLPDLPAEKVAPLAQEARAHLDALKLGTCLGADFTGWLKLPSETSNQLIAQIETHTTQLSKLYDTIVVVGIGGSYLGASALLQALEHQRTPKLEVIFSGMTIDPTYLQMQYERRLKGKKWCICVISKSGNTLEPKIAMNYLLDKMGSEELGMSQDRVIAITEYSESSSLYQRAQKEGWVTYEIPKNVGGRYSVLSSVGLFPLSCGGVNLLRLIEGAAEEELSLLQGPDSEGENSAIRYATARNLLLKEGKTLEVLATYTPMLSGLAEWYKQLFAESEGKAGKGLFPISASYTTDLHSLGQYIQQGQRLFFETHLAFRKSELDMPVISEPGSDIEGLGFDQLNKIALRATIDAHTSGHVPCIELLLEEQDAYNLGALIYFFELSCAINVLMQGNNPFDQPGVEEYKSNINRLVREARQ